MTECKHRGDLQETKHGNFYYCALLEERSAVHCGMSARRCEACTGEADGEFKKTLATALRVRIAQWKAIKSVPLSDAVEKFAELRGKTETEALLVSLAEHGMPVKDAETLATSIGISLEEAR